jgi:predicted DNA-binding transcriptional regulator YafY
MLVLLELLYNRPIVPLSTITEVCRVTERTAYRYLGALADANFPIEFDGDLGGYRLLGKRSIVSQFSDSETTILYFGTLLLEHFAGESALDSIKSTRIKLESRVSLKLQEVLASGKETLFNVTSPAAPREFVVLSMLLLAARRGAAIRVLFLDADGERQEIQINKPKILYDREWVAGEQNFEQDPTRIPIRQIQDIDLPKVS